MSPGDLCRTPFESLAQWGRSARGRPILSLHKAQRSGRVDPASGNSLRHLPVYSPDLSPSKRPGPASDSIFTQSKPGACMPLSGRSTKLLLTSRPTTPEPAMPGHGADIHAGS
jgi:hypothetical protein